MAEPPNLSTDNTNSTVSLGTHPALHNDANSAINELHNSVPRLLAEGQLSSVDVFFNDENKLVGTPVNFVADGPVIATFAVLVDVWGGALDLWLQLDAFGNVAHLAEIRDINAGPTPYFWRAGIDLSPGAHSLNVFGFAAANNATIHVDSTESWSTVLSVWSAPTGSFVHLYA